MSGSNDIGLILRQLREERKVSGRQLAVSLKTSPSYVSKMESGFLYPSEKFVKSVMEALKVGGRESRLVLALLKLRNIESHVFDAKAANAFEERQKLIAEIDRNTISYAAIQFTVVPGLLQIENYIRALFKFYPVHDHGDVQRAIARWKRRQRVLSNTRRKFAFVISESALRNNLCQTDVLKEQLLALCRTITSGRENLLIGILPTLQQLPTIPQCSFSLRDNRLVVIDTFSGFITQRHPQEIEQYRRAFEAFQNCCLVGDAAAKWLRKFSTEARD